MKINFETFDAYLVVVNVEGNIEDYALSFLNIFNNVRENKELFAVRNEPGSNRVAVTCDIDYLEETKEYLANFGKVEEDTIALVKCYEVDDFIDYDMEKYWGVMVLSEVQ